MRDEILAERAHAHEAAIQNVVAREERTLTALLDDLYRVKDMAMSAIPVLDSRGKATGEYRADLGNAIKAIVALGQQQFGAFVAKSQNVPADPRDLLSDEQIRQLQKTLQDAQNSDSRAVGGSAPVRQTTH